MIDAARDDDLGAIEAYLASRADTCMLLRSNLRAVGLAWSGARFQAEYVVARRGGAIVGVAGHTWNGLLLIQTDERAGELAIAAVARSGRRVSGFMGPYDQATTARTALGLDATPAIQHDDESLMALSLDALLVPPRLAAGAVRARLATAADRGTLIPWRAEYMIEGRLVPADRDPTDRATEGIDISIADQRLWLLEEDGAPVAMSAFNAVLPDCVQIGGVFTPPALRGRGHARAAVAGSLLAARAAGTTRAILYTHGGDAAAAYRAIGFTGIGRYGLILLEP